MPANLDKPDRWKADIAQSVDLYNHWFMQFAPVAAEGIDWVWEHRPGDLAELGL